MSGFASFCLFIRALSWQGFDLGGEAMVAYVSHVYLLSIDFKRPFDHFKANFYYNFLSWWCAEMLLILPKQLV